MLQRKVTVMLGLFYSMLLIACGEDLSQTQDDVQSPYNMTVPSHNTEECPEQSTDFTEVQKEWSQIISRWNAIYIETKTEYAGCQGEADKHDNLEGVKQHLDRCRDENIESTIELNNSLKFDVNETLKGRCSATIFTSSEYYLELNTDSDWDDDGLADGFEFALGSDPCSKNSIDRCSEDGQVDSDNDDIINMFDEYPHCFDRKEPLSEFEIYCSSSDRFP